MTAPIEPPKPVAPPAGEPPVTQPPAPAQPPAVDDRPLGPAGERALAAEREARKALEKQFAPFLALLNGNASSQGPAGDPLAALQERLAGHETELKTERAARWRAEVAAEAGLTPQQAARLNGGTRDELLADATALKTLFPTAPAAAGGANGTPAPDLSQGSRGTPVDLDADIALAEKEGRWHDVIGLKRQKARKK